MCHYSLFCVFTSMNSRWLQTRVYLVLLPISIHGIAATSYDHLAPEDSFLQLKGSIVQLKGSIAQHLNSD